MPNSLTQIPLNSCFAGKLGSKVFLRSGGVLLQRRNTNCGSSKSFSLSTVGSVIGRDPAAAVGFFWVVFIIGLFRRCSTILSLLLMFIVQVIAALFNLPPSRVMVSMNSGIFTRFTSFLSKTLQAACHRKMSRKEMLQGLTPLKFVAARCWKSALGISEIPFGMHHFQIPCWTLRVLLDLLSGSSSRGPTILKKKHCKYAVLISWFLTCDYWGVSNK